MKPSYTPNPNADTRTLLIYRDECGLMRANDIEMGRDVKNRAGSIVLSEDQVETIRQAYEARGYTVIRSRA